MLFGSDARGTRRADSDVDIGIFPVDANLSLQDELSLQTELARVCGRNVDLVRLDRAPTLVRWQVVRYGRVIMESTRFSAARFVAESVSDLVGVAERPGRAGRLRRRDRLAPRVRHPLLARPRFLRGCPGRRCRGLVQTRSLMECSRPRRHHPMRPPLT
jgi:hypothetical protein